MSDCRDLTVSLAAETKERLTKLAGHVHRDPSVLGAEAIADYVARELAIVEAVERGRADVRAGRVVPHADVVGAADDMAAGLGPVPLNHL